MKPIYLALYWATHWATHWAMRAGSGMWSSPSASAFADGEGQFPYAFFVALIATSGLGLGLWATHARQQQSLAIDDCIEAELVQDASAVNLERAAAMCEMKCIRGELSECL